MASTPRSRRPQRCWSLRSSALAPLALLALLLGSSCTLAHTVCDADSACEELWGLPRLQNGTEFDQLNAAAGFNSTDVVLISDDTTAALYTAQQWFKRNTLISAPLASFNVTPPGIYLGDEPGSLLVGAGVNLTFQEVALHNVFATLTLPPGTNTSTAAALGTGPGGWSFTLNSFDLGSGSLVRLKGVELVLTDCTVAKMLYELAAVTQAPGWRGDQVVVPDVHIHSLTSGSFWIENTVVTCNMVCAVGSAVRTLYVASHLQMYEALAIVHDHVDGCETYVIELQTNISLPLALNAGQAPMPAAAPSTAPAAENGTTSTAHRRAVLGRSLADSGPTATGVHLSRLGRTGALWDAGERAEGGGVTGWGRRSLKHAGAVRGLHVPVRVTVDLTIRGADPQTVFDTALMAGVFVVLPPARLIFENVVLLNPNCPQAGVLTLPMYVVDPVTRVTQYTMTAPPPSAAAPPPGSRQRPIPWLPLDPRILFRNATLVVPADELSYETTWVKSYADQPPTLQADLLIWLWSSVGSAMVTSLTRDTLVLSQLAAWDIHGLNLKITSVPPPGFSVLQPLMGMSWMATTPLQPYPQAVTLNSSAALSLLLNASVDTLWAQAEPDGGFVAYPGSRSSAVLSLLTAPFWPSTPQYEPVPYGPVTIRRNIVFGPYIMVSPWGSFMNVSKLPTLSLSRTRSTWARFASAALSLTVRNMTLIGLDAPSRWPYDTLIRVLDLPMWAIDVDRSINLAGNPPSIVLSGVVIAVSVQELSIWVECYEYLTGIADMGTVEEPTGPTPPPARPKAANPRLEAACRSLGIQAFKARRITVHVLHIELLQGMGMQLKNCTLCSETSPYQRYDLDELLPDTLATPPPGYGLTAVSDSSSDSHKWVIAVVVVVVVVAIAGALLIAVYMRHRREGGNPEPYVNVHMIKMMAETGERPYAVDTLTPGPGLPFFGGGHGVGANPSRRGAFLSQIRSGRTNTPGTEGTASQTARASFQDEPRAHLMGGLGATASASALGVGIHAGPGPSQGLAPMAGGANGPRAAGAMSAMASGEAPELSLQLQGSTAQQAAPTQQPQQAQQPLAGAGAERPWEYASHNSVVLPEPSGPSWPNSGAAVTAIAVSAAAAVAANASPTPSPHPSGGARGERTLGRAGSVPNDAATSIRRAAASPLLVGTSSGPSHGAHSAVERQLSGISPLASPGLARPPSLPILGAESDSAVSTGGQQISPGSSYVRRMMPSPPPPRPPSGVGRRVVDISTLSQPKHERSSGGPSPETTIGTAGAVSGGAAGARLFGSHSVKVRNVEMNSRDEINSMGSTAAGPFLLMMAAANGSTGGNLLSVASGTGSGGAGGGGNGSAPGPTPPLLLADSGEVVMGNLLSGTVADAVYGTRQATAPMLRTHSNLSNGSAASASLVDAPAPGPQESQHGGATGAGGLHSGSGGAQEPSTHRSTAGRAVTSADALPPKRYGAVAYDQDGAYVTSADAAFAGRAGAVAVMRAAPQQTISTGAVGVRQLQTSNLRAASAAAASVIDGGGAAMTSTAGSSFLGGAGSAGNTRNPSPQHTSSGNAASGPRGSMTGFGGHSRSSGSTGGDGAGQGLFDGASPPAPVQPILHRSGSLGHGRAYGVGGSSSGKSRTRSGGAGGAGSARRGADGAAGTDASPRNPGRRGFSAAASLSRLSEATVANRSDSSRNLTPTANDGGSSPKGTSAADGVAGKPGLGKMLAGSLSSLFRVDSLAGGVQRPLSPPPPGLAASSGSATAATTSGRTSRMSAVQLAEVGRSMGGAGAGGGDKGASNLARTSGSNPPGREGNRSAGRSTTGGGGGSSMDKRIMGTGGLEAALSEMTADVESRVNENQLVIQQILGSGAFGTVYKALWKGLQVAVKTMTLTSDAVTQGRHAALMEAALSKSIFHPNVVTTYTCDLKPMHVDSHRGGAMTGLQIANETEVIQEWRLYIVQEFCDGGSLRHAIEARSFLNPGTGTPQLEWVLQMSREVAAGLQYLHEHNIIHGDLNPANVLLKKDDTSVLGYTAKIADFGLSVHMQAEQSHVSNTKRGTPFYTAPEVAHAGNLTRFADVFSYGVMLWELYCSRSCWTYGPQGRLVHQRGFPHLPPTCPRPFALLVSTCMQPAHKQRPTFKQIGLQLDAMLRECERVVSAGGTAGSHNHTYPEMGWQHQQAQAQAQGLGPGLDPQDGMQQQGQQGQPQTGWASSTSTTFGPPGSAYPQPASPRAGGGNHPQPPPAPQQPSPSQPQPHPQAYPHSAAPGQPPHPPPPQTSRSSYGATASHSSNTHSSRFLASASGHGSVDGMASASGDANAGVHTSNTASGAPQNAWLQGRTTSSSGYASIHSTGTTVMLTGGAEADAASVGAGPGGPGTASSAGGGGAWAPASGGSAAAWSALRAQGSYGPSDTNTSTTNNSASTPPAGDGSAAAAAAAAMSAAAAAAAAAGSGAGSVNNSGSLPQLSRPPPLVMPRSMSPQLSRMSGASEHNIASSHASPPLSPGSLVLRVGSSGNNSTANGPTLPPPPPVEAERALMPRPSGGLSQPPPPAGGAASGGAPSGAAAAAAAADVAVAAAAAGLAAAAAATPAAAQGATSDSGENAMASEDAEGEGEDGSGGADEVAASLTPSAGSSAALAGVMRGFEIGAEVPRFGRPDLPTVLEAEEPITTDDLAGDGLLSLHDTDASPSPAVSTSQHAIGVGSASNSNAGRGYSGGQLGEGSNSGPHASVDSSALLRLVEDVPMATDGTDATPAVVVPAAAAKGGEAAAANAAAAEKEAQVSLGSKAPREVHLSEGGNERRSLAPLVSESGTEGELTAPMPPPSGSGGSGAPAPPFGRASISSPDGPEVPPYLALAAATAALPRPPLSTLPPYGSTGPMSVVVQPVMGPASTSVFERRSVRGRPATTGPLAAAVAASDPNVGPFARPSIGTYADAAASGGLRSVSPEMPQFGRPSLGRTAGEVASDAVLQGVPSPAAAAAAAAAAGGPFACPSQGPGRNGSPDVGRFGRPSLGWTAGETAGDAVNGAGGPAGPFARPSLGASGAASGGPARAGKPFARPSLGAGRTGSPEASGLPRFGRPSVGRTAGETAADAVYAANAAPAFARPSAGAFSDAAGPGSAANTPRFGRPSMGLSARDTAADATTSAMPPPPMLAPAAATSAPFARPSVKSPEGPAGPAFGPNGGLPNGHGPSPVAAAGPFVRPSLTAPPPLAAEAAGRGMPPPTAFVPPAAAMGSAMQFVRSTLGQPADVAAHDVMMQYQHPLPLPPPPPNAPGTSPFSRPSLATLNAAQASGGGPTAFASPSGMPPPPPLADPGFNLFVRPSMGVQQQTSVYETYQAAAVVPVVAAAVAGSHFARPTFSADQASAAPNGAVLLAPTGGPLLASRPPTAPSWPPHVPIITGPSLPALPIAAAFSAQPAHPPPQPPAPNGSATSTPAGGAGPTGPATATGAARVNGSQGRALADPCVHQVLAALGASQAASAAAASAPSPSGSATGDRAEGPPSATATADAQSQVPSEGAQADAQSPALMRITSDGGMASPAGTSSAQPSGNSPFVLTAAEPPHAPPTLHGGPSQFQYSSRYSGVFGSPVFQSTAANDMSLSLSHLGRNASGEPYNVAEVARSLSGAGLAAAAAAVDALYGNDGSVDAVAAAAAEALHEAEVAAAAAGPPRTLAAIAAGAGGSPSGRRFSDVEGASGRQPIGHSFDSARGPVHSPRRGGPQLWQSGGGRPGGGGGSFDSAMYSARQAPGVGVGGISRSLGPAFGAGNYPSGPQLRLSGSGPQLYGAYGSTPGGASGRYARPRSYHNLPRQGYGSHMSYPYPQQPGHMGGSLSQPYATMPAPFQNQIQNPNQLLPMGPMHISSSSRATGPISMLHQPSSAWVSPSGLAGPRSATTANMAGMLPPRFDRASLRSLDAAAAEAAAAEAEAGGGGGGGTISGANTASGANPPTEGGAASGVVTGPGGRHHVYSPGSFLRAIREAVVAGASKRRNSAASIRGPGSGSELALGGSSTSGGNRPLAQSLPPSFSRRGVSLADEAAAVVDSEDSGNHSSGGASHSRQMSPSSGGVDAAAALAGSASPGSLEGPGSLVGGGQATGGLGLAFGLGLAGGSVTSVSGAASGRGVSPFEAASGGSFDEALRMAKCSLSTVPESGASFSQTEFGSPPISQGSGPMTGGELNSATSPPPVTSGGLGGGGPGSVGRGSRRSSGVGTVKAGAAGGGGGSGGGAAAMLGRGEEGPFRRAGSLGRRSAGSSKGPSTGGMPSSSFLSGAGPGSEPLAVVAVSGRAGAGGGPGSGSQLPPPPFPRPGTPAAVSPATTPKASHLGSAERLAKRALAPPRVVAQAEVEAEAGVEGGLEQRGATEGGVGTPGDGGRSGVERAEAGEEAP